MSTEINVDDIEFTEEWYDTTFGSGFGWGITHPEPTPSGPKVDVWLINEDGYPLRNLASFHTSGSGHHSVLSLFLTDLTENIKDGWGDDILKDGWMA